MLYIITDKKKYLLTKFMFKGDKNVSNYPKNL